MLVPFEKDYRTIVENRLPNSCCPCRCPDVFCCGTLCSLKNVFNLIIRLERDINNDRKLFAIDIIDCGYFSNNDLVVYLRKNLIFITDKHADLLYIRLDKNRNGKIDYREVEDELQTVY